MRGNAHCQLIRRRVVHRADRQVGRTVVKSRTRSVLRRAWRTVIPYDGPSLNDICTLLSRYVRLAEAYDRKWKPNPRQSRFKPLLSPEESRRKFEQDLERGYGGNRSDTNHIGSSAQPAPPTCPEQRGHAGKESHRDQPVQSSPGSAGTVAPATSHAAPAPVSCEKKDVVAVPLVRTAGGLLRLDWAAAHG